MYFRHFGFGHCTANTPGGNEEDDDGVMNASLDAQPTDEIGLVGDLFLGQAA
jgi:hypothetical protein